MADTLITESGDTLMMETVAGYTGSSLLNDISVVTIFNEPFDTNPLTRGWIIGNDWEYDETNNRMQIM